MNPILRWTGELARSPQVGNFLLNRSRVGEVGAIQLSNLEGGGVFYRAAKRAVTWISRYCPQRYHRLARRIGWLENRRLVQGPGTFVLYLPWRVLTVDFRDFGDEDLSAAYLACGLVVQAFLLKHRYKRGDISDEQLVRLGRVAHRDAARFLKGLERDRPELARKVREVFPEFDSGLFLAGQRMPFARKIKFVRKRKPAAPRAN